MVVVDTGSGVSESVFMTNFYLVEGEGRGGESPTLCVHGAPLV